MFILLLFFHFNFRDFIFPLTDFLIYFFTERVTKEEKTLASAWPEELKLKQLDDDLLDDEDDDYYDEDYEEDDDLYDDEDDDDYYDDEEYYEDEYNDEGEKVLNYAPILFLYIKPLI